MSVCFHADVLYPVFGKKTFFFDNESWPPLIWIFSMCHQICFLHASSAAIIGARVFSVFSIIFQVVALMLGPFGMACTLFYMDAPRTKHRLVLFSGTLSILAGVFIGVAVSWYAALVVNDYSRDVMNQAQGIDTSIQRYVYGRALYYRRLRMID